MGFFYKGLNLSLVIISLLFCLSCFAQTENFKANASYQVCFSPGHDCTGKIVDDIYQAKHSIVVQAYSFTSKPIARALVAALQRGVSVKVILDKSDFQPDAHSLGRYLQKKKIPLWMDYQLNIAHNKVIVIDETEVITGSFNFTLGAEYHNAENVLMIHDAGLAKKYIENWANRCKNSQPVLN